MAVYARLCEGFDAAQSTIRSTCFVFDITWRPSAYGCLDNQRKESVASTVAEARACAKHPELISVLHLHGIITYHDPRWHLLFLQDATGGMAIPIGRDPVAVKPGDAVELSGILEPKTNSLGDLRISVVSPLKMPVPIDDSISSLLAKAQDIGTWVRTHGVVRSAAVEDGRFTMHIAGGNKNLTVRVMNPGNDDWEEPWSICRDVEGVLAGRWVTMIAARAFNFWCLIRSTCENPPQPLIRSHCRCGRLCRSGRQIREH